MAVARTPRERWIKEGLRALGTAGPDAVRVEQLAHAIGVTKGGFYWHFPTRGALLEEMLETWERAGVDDVIDQVNGGGGDARAKLQRLFGLAAATSDDLVQTDLAVRDWARRDPAVAARLQRVDDRRRTYLRALLAELYPHDDDIDARCLLAFTLWIGRHFVAADLGPGSRSGVLERAWSLILDAPPA